MPRRQPPTEDEKTWSIMAGFYAGPGYNQHGQVVSNPHQQKKRAEYKSHTIELEEVARRGLVEFDAETRMWVWTKAGADWCDTYLAGLKDV